MKRVVKLTEQELNQLIKRVIEEQNDGEYKAASWNSYPLIKDQIAKIKPDPGGKYCFNQKKIDEIGRMFNYLVYKIKRGDTFDKIKSMGNGEYSLKFANNLCDLTKRFNAGDVILIDMAP